MIKKVWILLLFSFIGCATAQRKGIYPTITNFVGSTDFGKYKRIAVLPFSDAPYAPQSGQIIQGLASQVLAQLGFEVAERSRLMDILQEQKMSASGLFDIDQSIKLGKLLGVRAIVVGEVGQYMTQQRKTDTTYFPTVNFYTGEQFYVPIQGKQWMESYVSLSVRILDVETGALIYSGSGQFEKGLANPPQQIAERILGEILAKWFISPGACGFSMDSIDKSTIKKIINGSPAQKAGLKIGDKILKINEKKISPNISKFEWGSIGYGYPGEKKIFQVKRDNEIFNIEIIMGSREEVFKNWKPKK